GVATGGGSRTKAKQRPGRHRMPEFGAARAPRDGSITIAPVVPPIVVGGSVRVERRVATGASVSAVALGGSGLPDTRPVPQTKGLSSLRDTAGRAVSSAAVGSSSSGRWIEGRGTRHAEGGDGRVEHRLQVVALRLDVGP